VNGSLIKFFHKKLVDAPCSKSQTKALKESDENTNQQDRNDSHEVTKLAKEKWEQTNTQIVKYGQNSEQTSG
jgi:hypothetical protein